MNGFNGYYRFPAVSKDKLIFSSESDLWLTSTKGGQAVRLTDIDGVAGQSVLSEDGKMIAMMSTETGQAEVYVMSSDGGVSERITYFGSHTYPVLWKGDNVIVASTFNQPYLNRITELYSVNYKTKEYKKLPYGAASEVSFGKNGTVLGRNTRDLARWKRYRGGTAGKLWIDVDNSGEFKRFMKDLNSNLANPMWIGDRIYFLSDHEGFSNIYSAKPDSTDIKRHTNHNKFFARNAKTDGKSIVYHCGGDIYIYDIEKDADKKLKIKYPSPRNQTKIKFVDAEKYLSDYDLSKDGSHIQITTRGKSFAMGCWEGAVSQYGKKQGARYKISRYTHDNKIVTVSDESGEYKLEVYDKDLMKPVKKLNVDIGNPNDIKVSPVKNEVVVYNHRDELIWVNLSNGQNKVIVKGKHDMLKGFSWSPDGRWVAFSSNDDKTKASIKIYDLKTDEVKKVSEAIKFDVNPTFDPEGKYLYFLSVREFNPVYDNLHFDLNFQKGFKPVLITLKKDTPSPFIPEPKGFSEDGDHSHEEDDKKKGKDKKKKDAVKPVEIDFDGIEERLIELPVQEDNYLDIEAGKDKVFYSVGPIKGAIGSDDDDDEATTVKYYDMKELFEEEYATDVYSFTLSLDKSAFAYFCDNGLRVLESSKMPKEADEDKHNVPRRTGWIDFSRIKVSVEPLKEWQQMLTEIWRLQRDYFWVEDMSGIDWQEVLKRYYPLLDRVSTRNEFSDLAWELQGELGTSHAYEFGGDYKVNSYYRVGHLGADFTYDAEKKAYRIDKIVKGDFWQGKSPLTRLGVNISEGDYLTAINGIEMSLENTPNSLLVNLANTEVNITVKDAKFENERTVTVKTIGSDVMLRYRDWVEANRKYVHEKSGGKVGYVHVPDMGADGYAEFFRYYLQEYDHDGLIVDVRYNGGGHVSMLLLEKLARKRIGYDLSRWWGLVPYPSESVKGSIVALTNEHAGSDGDIFSHSFKLMGLGKLIGMRTWGGVIGIWPRNPLVDGTITSQPEFSFWFKDVGWEVENYGTDPDIEIDIAPHEWAKGDDPQLDRAIKEALDEIEKNPPIMPDISEKGRPNLKVPTLK